MPKSYVIIKRHKPSFWTSYIRIFLIWKCPYIYIYRYIHMSLLEKALPELWGQNPICIALVCPGMLQTLSWRCNWICAYPSQSPNSFLPVNIFLLACLERGQSNIFFLFPFVLFFTVSDSKLTGRWTHQEEFMLRPWKHRFFIVSMHQLSLCCA